VREAAVASVQNPAVAVERENAPSPIVLLCDHASHRLPSRYDALGLSDSDLLRHFAWDPGALETCRALSRLLDAPLVYGCISRLALDVNRHPSDPDSIVLEGAGLPIPGNAGLSVAERARRVVEIYDPYHAAVERLLSQRRTADKPTVVVALHTYTAVLHGIVRPWHCGIIFGDDTRMGDALVSGLRDEPGLIVGVNEPYAPSDRVYHTLLRHGEANGLPTAMIEVRNDLVIDGEAQTTWAKRLAPLLLAAARRCLDAEGAEWVT
jgi:predicted N-formylglutamate amidohydrolase